MARKRHYSLTETAAHDFRIAKKWSLDRWGKALTKEYFEDLHNGVEYIALNQRTVQQRDDLTGNTGVCIHAVREHYVVYVPINDTEIVVLALIRQTRDVPKILKENAFKIAKELQAAKTDE